MPYPIGENIAKKRLAAGELVLCMGVNQMRTPNIALIAAAACSFDAVYIDLEHNPASLEAAAGICVAALAADITPIARVSSHDATGILDSGAQGVTVPHVNNAVGGVRQDFEFQSWLFGIGVRYLTVGSDVGYILSAGRADLKRLREVPLSPGRSAAWPACRC